jgi:hypothetical protein
MKSLGFLKPTLATTLAIVLAWLLSVRPAQAGYTVTLQQVGPDVVATGSGAINLTGLTFLSSGSVVNPAIHPHPLIGEARASIYTGPTSSSVDRYDGLSGPQSFGSGPFTFVIPASSGSGDMVGISTGGCCGINLLSVPTGYVSGTALSDTAIYGGTTIASLGVTPGTYVWTWGTTENQNFTLQTLPGILPGTNITNMSTRASVQTVQGVTIAGFIVTGTDPKQVVIRGLGPTLTNSNVTGVLADPTLGLYDGSGSLIFSNNDWKNTQQAAIEATGLAPSFDLESAILITLQPGNYTAILSGNNGTTGVGLVEAYDLDTATNSQFANISTRGFVDTVDKVLIGGFILGGGTANVIARAIGPSLTGLDVAGALQDPTLELHDGSGTLVASNDNWRTDQQAEIIATGVAPSDDRESAILSTLAPGAYTVIVRGVLDTTGVGLVEVYRIP